MASKKHADFLLSFVLFFSLVTLSVNGFAKPQANVVQYDAEKTWYLGGFLNSDPSQKKWIAIKGKLIAGVSTEKPKVDGALVVDTEKFFDSGALIFPGMVDHHNHMMYNFLPLLEEAEGQFDYRQVWRDWPPYKKAVLEKSKPVRSPKLAEDDPLKAIKSDIIRCAAVRWAEIMALTGGATAIQGIGISKLYQCGRNFGIHNLEITGEYGEKGTIRTRLDVISPNELEAFSYLEKYYYGKAYQEVLVAVKALNGIDSFKDEDTRKLLAIVLGDVLKDVKVKVEGQKGSSSAADLAELDSKEASVLFGALVKQAREDEVPLEERLKKILEGEKGLLKNSDHPDIYAMTFNKAAAAIQADAVAGVVKPWTTKIKDKKTKQLVETEFTVEMLQKWVKDFGLTGFGSKTATRRTVLSYFKANEDNVYIIHLCEGRRDNAYNQWEFEYVKKAGLARSGLVIIHGVGMNREAMEYAKKWGISIVWSPWSNLLLYGESLNVEMALDIGLNVAFGPDWTPSGSKNLLDELKMGRRYLDTQKMDISNETLADMVTINAAKSLKLVTPRAGLTKDQSKAFMKYVRLEKLVPKGTKLSEKEQLLLLQDLLDKGGERIPELAAIQPEITRPCIGAIKPGCQADLTLVTNHEAEDTAQAADMLVQSKQEDVELVVISGRPTYGDLTLMEAVHVDDQIQELPLSTRTKRCKVFSDRRKGLFAPPTEFDAKVVAAGLETDVTQVSEMATQIAAILGEEPNPIFTCEDEGYEEDITSFKIAGALGAAALMFFASGYLLLLAPVRRRRKRK